MSPAAHSKEGEEPNEEALVGRLRRFIDDSDLSFYRIASLIGTSGTFLSMWLARTAKPHTADFAAKIGGFCLAERSHVLFSVYRDCPYRRPCM